MHAGNVKLRRMGIPAQVAHRGSETMSQAGAQRLVCA